MLIHHVALASDWAAAQAQGDYRISTLGVTLDQEGFLHCSRVEQWQGVRERYYGDVAEPLLLLTIDTDRLTSAWRHDTVSNGEGPNAETYPHIHGPLNLDAVCAILPLVRIWRSFDQVPADLGRTVVVIGNFDGVHLGHQHVIARARELADADGLRLVTVTFDPHPMAVLRPEHAPLALTDLETRSLLLQHAGADDVLVIPFSRDIASWTPEEFVQRALVDSLNVKAVVVGANFRFGNKAAGDVAFLTSSGSAHDFTVEGIPLDGGPQVWSSTYVRTCLAAGDVEGAAEALGRPFSVAGKVMRGDQRGRELGFPTANVPTRGIAAPADGVYAGWLRRLDDPESEPLPAAISVGTNPTFDGERERRVEAYVLDRTDLELYDVPVEISFVARVRGMVKFESIEKLVETMNGDVEQARTLLS